MAWSVCVYPLTEPQLVQKRSPAAHSSEPVFVRPIDERIIMDRVRKYWLLWPAIKRADCPSLRVQTRARAGCARKRPFAHSSFSREVAGCSPSLPRVALLPLRSCANYSSPTSRSRPEPPRDAVPPTPGSASSPTPSSGFCSPARPTPDGSKPSKRCCPATPRRNTWPRSSLASATPTPPSTSSTGLAAAAPAGPTPQTPSLTRSSCASSPGPVAFPRPVSCSTR